MRNNDENQHTTENLGAWITERIQEFCRTSPENSLKNRGNDRAWDEPLVGFSRGGDSLFELMQKDIGSPYLLPIEIFRKSFPDTDAKADDLTVISWILPHIPETIADNAKETSLPSERWARAKHFGSKFDKILSRYVVDLLKHAGYMAVAPQYTPFCTIGMSQKYGFASVWSERHAAYVSGLGTFGLCDGLITPKGKAMRCGSVIARVKILPTPRPYTNPHAYCLHFTHDTCRKCITRCPAGAISEKGHDKKVCNEYLMGITSPYVKSQFGIDDYGCGLCQTGVPCDSRNPVRNERAKGN
ncbi:epoxyqueuosine reductase [Methanoregula sp.]|jgi:epoxyqueuosine reductase QueG|uniref:epoxyqueuosine reductase n=1 Tax=Methanoregula sp. TaxID=2052170 RepID=UPI003BAE3DB0